MVVWKGWGPEGGECYNIDSDIVEKSEVEPGMELRAGLRTCQN